MLIALKNLFKDKTRLALSIGGVALAVMLILLLNGFLIGMNAQISAYLDHAPGSIVVAQDGVSNLLGVTSLLPQGAEGTVKARGAEKVVPHYNIMGVAKAALEATTRYLAYDFGPQGVRVNAISAGPIRTLAAAGVSGFKDMYRAFAEMSPLRQNVTIQDVGNAAVFLCSNMAAKTTGEVLYVDSGYNIMGVPEPQEKEI